MSKSKTISDWHAQAMRHWDKHLKLKRAGKGNTTTWAQKAFEAEKQAYVLASNTGASEKTCTVLLNSVYVIGDELKQNS